MEKKTCFSCGQSIREGWEYEIDATNYCEDCYKKERAYARRFGMPKSSTSKRRKPMKKNKKSAKKSIKKQLAIAGYKALKQAGIKDSFIKSHVVFM